MKNYLQKRLLALLTIFFTMVNAMVQAQCPSDIISYWNLDEKTGTVYDDKAGSHDATVENAPANVDGAIGYGKYFDGTKRLSIPSHADFNFGSTTSFSVELWTKFTDISSGIRSKVMIGRNDTYSSNEGIWWLGNVITTGVLEFWLQDNNGTQIYVTAPKINDDAWHHVVAIRNATDKTLKLYVDGILKGTTENANFSGNFSSTAPIQIGYLTRLDVPDYFFKGTLDDIAIYRRALSGAEISDHHTRGLMELGYCDGNAPVITSEPVLTAAVGQTYTYDVNARGMAPVTYSLEKAPANMTINSSTGLISWTPASTNVDSKVIVVATNVNYPPAAKQTFYINVSAAASCPSGLINLWKLNESAGPVYYDEYGNNATSTDAPSAVSGIVNGAQLFDGTNELTAKANSLYDWTQTASFSFEVWIKTDNTANTISQAFIGRKRNDGWYTAWSLGMDYREIPFFYLSDAFGMDTLVYGTESVADGLWHHVVGVRNNSNDMNQLYIDGEKVGEARINYTHSFDTEPLDSVPVTIGWFNSGDMHHFTGEMDEVAIFNKALTQTDVSAYYNAGAPVGHCKPGNYAPVIKSEPGLTVAQGSEYTYSFVTDDYDLTDNLVLAITQKPSWLTFNWTAGQRTASITGTPENGDVGNASVTLTVTDNTVTKTQNFTIEVTNVNDAPEITSTPVTSVDESSLYTYDVAATDIDVNDVLTFSASVKPAWLSINATTGVLTGTPSHEDVGDHDVTVVVSDGTATNEQSFTITVNSINQAPVITGQETLTMVENTKRKLTVEDLTVTDPDNTFPDDFTITVHDGDNYSVSGDTIIPSTDFVGNLNVGVQVNDGLASSSIYYALVEVTPFVSVKETHAGVFNVFPVPAKDQLTFDFVKSLRYSKIEIYNAGGTLVKVQQIDEAREIVPLTGMDSGFYIYRVQADQVNYQGTFNIVK